MGLVSGMLGETTTALDTTGGVHFNSNDGTTDENSVCIAPKENGNDDLENNDSPFSHSHEANDDDLAFNLDENSGVGTQYEVGSLQNSDDELTLNLDEKSGVGTQHALGLLQSDDDGLTFSLDEKSGVGTQHALGLLQSDDDELTFSLDEKVA